MSAVVKLCPAAGIGTSTYYRWFDCPEFRVWWKGEFDKWAAHQLPRILAAAIASAVGRDSAGSPADRKLLLERYDKGYQPTSKQKIEGHVTHSAVIAQAMNGGFKRTNRISRAIDGLEGDTPGGSTPDDN